MKNSRVCVCIYIFFFLLLPCRTGERVPLHCVDRHPNQQHIVATGGQDGMLSIWDIRQGTMPVSLLNAHEAESEYLDWSREKKAFLEQLLKILDKNLDAL